MELTLIQEKIYNIIEENNLLPKGNIIEFDTSLKEYGLDSIGIVDMIVTIEEEYLFEFSANDLDLKNFESINTIANLVYSKCKAVQT